MEYSLSDITNTLEYKLGNAILSHKRITGGGGGTPTILILIPWNLFSKFEKQNLLKEKSRNSIKK